MKNESFNSTENLDTNIEDIIKNKAIDAATVEKLGAIYLSFGYATFTNATNIDILEALDSNKTGLTSFNILVFGQKFILLGYILLYISSSKRLNEKTIANLYRDDTNDLSVFETLKNGYLGDVTLSYLRLLGFIKLEQQENQKGDKPV